MGGESCDETQPVTTIRDDDPTADEHTSPRYLDLSGQSCDETQPAEDPAEGESSIECEGSSEGENDVETSRDKTSRGPRRVGARRVASLCEQIDSNLWANFYIDYEIEARKIVSLFWASICRCF